MQVHQPPTLLLTRPRAAAERFAAGLEGGEVVIAPLMKIEGTGAVVNRDGIRALILTSENAVAFAPGGAMPAYCVGVRTAQAAKASGFEAELPGADADSLVTALLDRQPDGPLLHIHGVHTRGDVAARLRAGGLDARGVAAYDQRAVPPGPEFFDALARPRLIVPLFSPRSASLFAEAARHHLRPDTQLLALSPAVAAALPERMHRQVGVISHPNGAEMGKALEPFGMRRISP